MDSLANYGSDDDNDSSPSEGKQADWQTGGAKSKSLSHQSSSLDKQEDTDYEEVQMDLSEESNESRNGRDAASSSSCRNEKLGRERREDTRASPPSHNNRRSREDSTQHRRDRKNDERQHSRDSRDDDRTKDRRDEDRYRNRRDDDNRSGSRSDRNASGHSSREDKGGRDRKYKRSSSRERNKRSRSRDDRKRSSSREKRWSRSPKRGDRESRRSRSRSRGRYGGAKRFDRFAGKGSFEKSETQKSCDGDKGATDATAKDRFFMPGITGRFRDQIERRKMLWQKKAVPEPTPPMMIPAPQKPQARQVATSASTSGGAGGSSRVTKLWEATTFAQDSDGKVASKFKRLMGIKGQVDVTNPKMDVLKKQEEMFSSMEQQYEVARTATHTMRGVGLGFSSTYQR